MASTIDMSLDDIIKENRKNKQQQKKPLAKGSRPKDGAPRKPGKPDGGARNKPWGGIARDRNHGGISRHRPAAGGFAGRTGNPAKRQALFNAALTGARKFGSEATKLIVSNLDFGVTDMDILELFSEFGPLKRAGVRYDRFGRSLGSADLLFERRADAIKAMRQYNGVPLDGRVMNIQLVTSEIPNANPARANRPGISPAKRRPFTKGKRLGATANGKAGGKQTDKAEAKAGGKAGGKTGTEGAKRGPKTKKQPKKQPTVEELDADLDEYVKSRVTSGDAA